MAEYIEREAAKKVAERYGCKNGSALGRHSGLSDCIASEIDKLPPADVAPVVHGRWISFGGNHYTRISQCTNCCAKYDFRSNYCPNCGAKMDGVQLE